MLDYNHQYRIDRVGIYLSRQGKLVIWDVADFLHLLGATHPITDLRARLRAGLARLAASARQPRQTALDLACEYLEQCR